MAELDPRQPEWLALMGPFFDENQVRDRLQGLDDRKSLDQLVQQGELLAVLWKRAFLFPAFQFGEHSVLDGLPPVLVTLDRSELSPLTKIYWFLTRNRHLGNDTPAEWLAEGRDLAAVIEAANRLTERFTA